MITVASTDGAGEKVIAMDDEHPALTRHKQQHHAGRSIGTELARTRQMLSLPLTCSIGANDG